MLGRLAPKFEEIQTAADILVEHFSSDELEMLADMPYPFRDVIAEMTEQEDDLDYYFDRDRHIGIKARYKQGLAKAA